MSSFSDPIACCALCFLWWWNCCLLFRLLARMPHKHGCASALLALCLLLLDPRCTFLLFRKYPEPCFSLPKASCRLSVPRFLRQCFVLILQYKGLLLFSVDNCSSVVVNLSKGAGHVDCLPWSGVNIAFLSRLGTLTRYPCLLYFQ